MAGIAVRMTAQKENSLQKIHETIHAIKDVEQVKKLEAKIHDATIWLLVYEKYFFRTSNYASLTVLLTEQDMLQTADIVISGAGDALANLSWGADEKLAKSCVKALESLGFVIDQTNSDELPIGFLEKLFK